MWEITALCSDGERRFDRAVRSGAPARALMDAIRDSLLGRVVVGYRSGDGQLSTSGEAVTIVAYRFRKIP